MRTVPDSAAETAADGLNVTNAARAETGTHGAQAAPGWRAAVEPLRCSAVLTHHWLVRRRGGEKVLAALRELLPGAAIHTLVFDEAGAGPGWRPVRTSWLQRLPGARRHYPKLLPLMPAAARRMHLPPADLVVCSDAALAKAMTPHPRSVVVCYCHSPMRYVWDLAAEYRRTLPQPVRPLWDALLPYLRRADREAAQRVDVFVANSRHVADRIRRHYGRESVVVYPPVDLADAPAEGAVGAGRAEDARMRGPRAAAREGFYLCVGHHVPYKRLDLAVAACRRLGRRLVVVGDGPDVDALRRGGRGGRATNGAGDGTADDAGAVSLLGWQEGPALADFYARAAGLLFPGEEDFGIVPVEAMAHGCPVIALGRGGACETVVDGVTGVLFAEQSVEGLVDAMRRFERMSFEPRLLRDQAQKFARQRFLREMRDVLERALARAPCDPSDRRPGVP